MVKLFGKKGKLNKIRKGVSKDLGHLASKGHAAIKDYAEKAPERRAARIDKLNQQAQIAEAEARLASAQAKKQKAQATARPAGMGMGMGMGSPSMGMGAPSIGLGSPSIGTPAKKPKTRKKTKRQPRVVIY